MPIENRVGDIFAQPDVNVIVHQANLYHTFGAGIAKIIRENHPEAYAADCKTAKGDESKLGTFSSSGNLPNGKFILNMYSQTGIGGQDRNTSYDAMVTALTKIERTLIKFNEKRATPLVLGIPYTIGCGLAGGSWLICSAIIKSIFDKSPIKVVVCRLPDQPEVESVFDTAPVSVTAKPADEVF